MCICVVFACFFLLQPPFALLPPLGGKKARGEISWPWTSLSRRDKLLYISFLPSKQMLYGCTFPHFLLYKDKKSLITAKKIRKILTLSTKNNKKEGKK